VSAPARRSPPKIEAADGTQLFIREWGAGRPVVFVHGWAMNCDIWQYAMASLAAHARCIAYDKRGHGRSTDPGNRYDYDTLADDLASVLDQLDLHDTILVGHSMGPPEIVRYLSRHGSDRVARLVLISSALPFMLRTPDNPEGIDAGVFDERRRQWLVDMPTFLAANARSFVLPDTSAETVAWVASLGRQASLQALIQFNHTITETDLRGDVKQITLPTLILHGSQDQSAPLELTSKRLASMVAASTLRIYDGAPHGLLLTHQQRLNSDLLEWIQA
jgi:non-heme chloroperoxidase